MDTVHNIGPLHIQFNWDFNGWYYVNRQGEKINMNFFIGSIEPNEGDCKLYQFIIGPFMMSWAWK